MRAKKVPIEAAKKVAKEFDQAQVIMLTWCDKTGDTQCITYGKDLKNCKMAAEGGNVIKRFLNTRGANFSEEACNAQPNEAKKK